MLLFLCLTAAYTNWVLLDISNKIFVGAGGGDATAGFLWLNTLSPGLSPILGHTDMVNYPVGENLSSPTHATYALLWLPMRLLAYLFDPVAALNIVTVSAFVITAMATYWLVKRLTRTIPVALFAGFAAAFVPYSLMKGSAHLSYTYSGVFVFIFATFLGFWLRPTMIRSVLFALSIAAAFYTDGYFILIASVMVAALCIGGLIFEVYRKRWRGLVTRLKGLGVALVVLLFAISPLAYIQLSQGDQVKQGLAELRSDIAKEFELYQTELLDFIVPVEHPLLSHSSKYQKLQGIKNLRSNPSENANYVGVVVVLLGVLGLAFMFAYLLKRSGTLSGLGRYERNLFLLVGTLTITTTLVFLSFMFSPSIYVLGHTIYLPGQVLLDHNIALWRVMSRFFIPLHIILVIFAAYSAWVLLKVKTQNYRSTSTKLIIWGVMLILTSLTALEYLTTANRPSFEMKQIPATYTWLKEQEDIRVVAELPIVNQLDLLTGDYLTHQLIHGKRLVNDRTGSSNGTLGYYGTVDNPETIDFVRNRGADAIIVSATKCDSAVPWGELIYSETVLNPKNPKLCTYRLIKSDVDLFYAKTKKGILTTPLFSETYEQTSVIEQSIVELDVARLDGTEGFSESLHLSMEFVPVLDLNFDGTWIIKQRGEVLASGEIINSRGRINSSVNAAAPVTLEIRPSTGNKLTRHGIGIQNLILNTVEAR